VPAPVFNPVTLTAGAYDGLPGDLLPVLPDGTPQATRIQAMIDYLEDLGGGTVDLRNPGATIALGTTGVTLPATGTVSLLSDEATKLTYAGTGSAITVLGTAYTPLRGVWLEGPNSTSSLSNTSIGVDITGVRLRFYDCTIAYFGRGWDWAHDNTWLVSVIGGETHNCGIGVYNDNVTAGADNAGEQMVLDHHTIYNSGRAIDVRGAGVDFKMTNCSIDFCGEFGYISDAWVYFTACHMETQGGTSGTYVFDVRANSKVSFANCDIILGDGSTGTLNYLFKSTEGPSNYGNGQAHFANTKIYCAKPGGGNITQWSEQLIEWPNDGTTTQVDTWTPYPLFWCPVSAHEVAQSFRGTSTTQATIGCSDPGGNMSFGNLRLTSTPGYKMIRLRFG
jgi:hypothetical protein